MKNRIFIIADTHFDHGNMIEYCGRPENFNELIWEGLKEIRENDFLIHLGDFAFSNEEENHFHFNGIVKCKKILVRGNHDHKSDHYYLEHGWNFICESFINTYFGKKILFSHEPAVSGDYDLNIHGHLHNNLPRLLRKEFISDKEEERNMKFLYKLTEKNKLLAMEFTDYKPVNLETFIS